MTTDAAGDRDPEGYADLRSYAAIGDGRTVALVARDGSIDWLPLPSIHSTPVFARLLDAEAGGSIDLAPSVPFTTDREYVDGTNVLVTTFTTDSGVARVTDALVTGVAGRLPWTELARRIDGVSGSVHFRWRVAPGTCLGLASPWVEQTVHGKVIRVDGRTLAVRGLDHGPRGGGDRAMAGSFTTSPGSRHLLTMSSSGDEPIHVPEPRKTDEGVDRTIENWRTWSREFRYDGPWSDAVQRSALALKLLLFSPSGAIAAAATTSLPENLAGGKNWDYRFGWVRDVAYSVSALVRFGLREETHAAVSWLLSTIDADGPDLRVFYTLDGDEAPPVETRDVPGWRGIGPVVVGNPAGEQLQLGVYGDLFRVMLTYVRAGNLLDARTSHMLTGLADRVCDAWRRQDSGMWELPETQHYTSSKMGCWSALDSAIALHGMGQIDGRVERWTVERDAIAEWVNERCWSEKRRAYVMFPGAEELDTSVLLHAPSGFERGKRMATTIDTIRTELGRGPLLYRYSGIEPEEGTFVASAFWMVAALACVGRVDESRELMDELVGLANDVGLFAEMIDPDDSAFLGNLPQGLSHLSLITAALTFEELAG